VFAARILKAMNEAQSISEGAVGLDGKMIDAPMVKQVFYAAKCEMSAEKIFCRLERSLRWRKLLTSIYRSNGYVVYEEYV